MSLPLKYACKRLSTGSSGSHRQAWSWLRRGFATQSTNEPQNIAILGGGITGLSAAIDLLKKETPCRITILESQDRLGGWITSDFVDVPGGRVLFEKGSRTLRPAGASGLVTLAMVHHLGLEEEMLTCSKDSAAAKNRYIYYPDHLVRMPSSLADLPKFLFQEPLAKGIATGLVNDILTPYNAAIEGASASVADVFSHRFDPAMVNLISAVLHGIYAGNVEHLNFSALFPGLHHDMMRHGGIMKGVINNIEESWRGQVTLPKVDVATISEIMQNWQERQAERKGAYRIEERIAALQTAKKSSVFSFKNGMQQLADRMAEILRADPQVSIETNCAVSSIRIEEDTDGSNLLVKSGADGGTDRRFTHVISTIPAKSLRPILGNPDHKLLTDQNINMNLLSNDAVNVMVINLWFPQPNLVPVKGFGYLIPRDIPAGQNPELGLGVIFDSDAIQGQDTVGGTKLTVMMGGHYWDDIPEQYLPSESEAISSARSLIARHLGITEEPLVTCATMRRNCIPQYGPSHLDNLRRLKKIVQDKYKGRLLLAGSSYDGVGVNDCIRSGIFASQSLDNGRAGLFKSYVQPGQSSSFVTMQKEYLQWNFPQQ